jgi:glycosyltransferase involved in cell wall biosynthesis
VKVLHVTTSLGQGGAETVLFRLVGASPMIQHRVALLGDAYTHYVPYLRDLGVDVDKVGLDRGVTPLPGMMRLYQSIRQFSPDVVQTWMYHANLFGGLAARAAGVPRIFWGIRSHARSAAAPASTRIVSSLCGFLSSRVPTGIISCSERARTSHIAQGYEASKFLVIPNGYDLSTFRPDESLRRRFREELGLDRHDVVVGMVARWHTDKDHANLLAAMRIVWRTQPQVRLVLAGFDMVAENTALLQLVNSADGKHRTMLLGRRDDVAAVMNGLDLHVLSSSTEGFPNAIAEAMACGTPCVSTDVGDASLIIGETGLVAPSGNPGALASAIDSALRAFSIGRRNENCVNLIRDRFSMDRMAASYLDTWAGHTA